ncbi:MAG: hypothetical protein AB7Q42_06565 [Acidimicrobiia bacterium]
MRLHPAAGHEAPPAAASLTISCDQCSMRATSACDDCVVTYICERAPDDSVVFDVAEQRAVRLLAQAGLVPTLRHRAAAL